MRIVFPSDPVTPKRVDEAFSDEESASREAGLGAALVDHDALVAGDVSAAVSRIREPGPAIYRGWMLTVQQYTALYDALALRGVQLINDPTQYRYAHHLPENLGDLGDATPPSLCIPIAELDWASLPACLAAFGDGALVVKDWVKSRKHEWHEACYIPRASDTATVEKIARRFVELQGPDLTGGLVFRAFETFEPIGCHPSGMPLTKELRQFYLDGVLLVGGAYWDQGDCSAMPDFAPLAAKLRSRFFTLDLAHRTDGVWRVVEMGDGQVSGLQTIPAATFYTALAQWARR